MQIQNENFDVSNIEIVYDRTRYPVYEYTHRLDVLYIVSGSKKLDSRSTSNIRHKPTASSTTFHTPSGTWYTHSRRESTERHAKQQQTAKCTETGYKASSLQMSRLQVLQSYEYGERMLSSGSQEEEDEDAHVLKVVQKRKNQRCQHRHQVVMRWGQGVRQDRRKTPLPNRSSKKYG